MPPDFSSIDQILNRLEQLPGWEKFREHRHLLICWNQIVNEKIAQHTRPLYVNQRILYVATSSSARAQELSFQRYVLLKRLNHCLSQDLKDIRFSSSQWHQPAESHLEQSKLFTISDRQRDKTQQNSLSLLDIKLEGSSSRQRQKSQLNTPTNKAINAAQRWIEKVKANSSTLPSCSVCNSPTPQGEINRWNCCYHCISQYWSEAYNPPFYPEKNKQLSKEE